jgi:hypothetical protein
LVFEFIEIEDMSCGIPTTITFDDFVVRSRTLGATIDERSTIVPGEVAIEKLSLSNLRSGWMLERATFNVACRQTTSKLAFYLHVSPPLHAVKPYQSLPLLPLV